MTLAEVREALRHRDRGRGWWAGPRWTALQAAKSWGLTPDGWRAASPEARCEMMAEHRAAQTKQAWESLTDKERRRAESMWKEEKGKRG